MSLAVSGYVKQFYKGNIFGATAAGRKGYDLRSLISADMQATRRALKELHGFDYDSIEEDEDKEKLDRTVQAYVDTYNNYLNSAGSLDHDDVNRDLSKMKKLAGKYKDEFAQIGIKVHNNGSLSVDEETLEKASKIKIKKFFSQDTGYGTQLEKHMKKIQTTVRRNNLGMPVVSQAKKEQSPSQNEDDAKLVSILAEALEGSRINQVI